jgi:hypothetical protein
MTRQIVERYSQHSSAWDKSLAETSRQRTETRKRSTPSTKESTAPLQQTLITVILEIETLQVKVKPQNAVSQDFVNWPYSSSGTVSSQLLPAVIAYDGEQPLWGFGVPDDVPRVANLRALLEPKRCCDDLKKVAQIQLVALENGKTAIKMISDFLRAALQHVRIKCGEADSISYRHCFVLPSYWSECQEGWYMDIIRQAGIHRKSVSFLRDTEVGALYMAAKLFIPGAPRRGIVWMPTEGMFPLL